MTFNKLYKKDKSGKVRDWNIEVVRYDDYSLIITTHGLDRKVESTLRIDGGKNLGKSNETNHYTQAVQEAQSKWTKKRETYTDQMEAQNENEFKLPMLANKFKDVTFPCFIQTKLDGYRCIYNSIKGSISSRQGKSFDIVKNTIILMDELRQLNNYIFDGELYIHGDLFENLGILRKKKLTNDDILKLENIEYHIYDIIDEKLGYSERLKILEQLIKGFTRIKLISNYKVNNMEELNKKHAENIKNGYEGSIIRTLNGKYKCDGRSNDLLKHKDFQDAEYPINSYTVDKENCIIWVCKNGNIEFSVRPKGTREERQALYKECLENFDKYKNRNLWVKYFELTSFNVPRFPTTARNTVSEYIRDEII